MAVCAPKLWMTGRHLAGLTRKCLLPSCYYPVVRSYYPVVRSYYPVVRSYYPVVRSYYLVVRSYYPVVAKGVSSFATLCKLM